MGWRADSARGKEGQRVSTGLQACTSNRLLGYPLQLCVSSRPVVRLQHADKRDQGFVQIGKPFIYPVFLR